MKLINYRNLTVRVLSAALLFSLVAAGPSDVFAGKLGGVGGYKFKVDDQGGGGILAETGQAAVGGADVGKQPAPDARPHVVRANNVNWHAPRFIQMAWLSFFLR